MPGRDFGVQRPLLIVTPSRDDAATLSTVGMAAINVKKGGIIFAAALLWNPKIWREHVLILASRAAKHSVSRQVKITAISGLTAPISGLFASERPSLPSARQCA